MTASDDSRANRTEADPDRSPVEEDRSPLAVFRWACPICGESRTGLASDGEDPWGKAEFSLRQHVKTTEGDDHGPANVYPPEFDPGTAYRAVSIS